MNINNISKIEFKEVRDLFARLGIRVNVINPFTEQGGEYYHQIALPSNGIYIVSEQQLDATITRFSSHYESLPTKSLTGRNPDVWKIEEDEEGNKIEITYGMRLAYLSGIFEARKRREEMMTTTQRIARLEAQLEAYKTPAQKKNDITKEIEALKKKIKE